MKGMEYKLTFFTLQLTLSLADDPFPASPNVVPLHPSGFEQMTPSMKN